MSKHIVALGQPAVSSSDPQVKKLFCGIDVGAETLAIAVVELDRPCIQREFAKTITGHKALLTWLKKMEAQVRVSLEATGIYSMDLALALDATEYVEVAVLNPKGFTTLREHFGGRKHTQQMLKCWPSSVCACPL